MHERAAQARELEDVAVLVRFKLISRRLTLANAVRDGESIEHNEARGHAGGEHRHHEQATDISEPQGPKAGFPPLVPLARSRLAAHGR